MWTGDNAPSVADTWKDSHGAALAEDIFNGVSKPKSLLLAPYDNPDNNSPADRSQRAYRRDTWPADATEPKQNEPHTWGDTTYVVDALVLVNAKDSVILNGSDRGTVSIGEHGARIKATFDVTAYRVEDRVFIFDLTG